MEFHRRCNLQNSWQNLSQIPGTSPISDAVSKDMVVCGFKFCGCTVLYAVMQATGMVNNPIVSCYRYKELCKG